MLEPLLDIRRDIRPSADQGVADDHLFRREREVRRYRGDRVDTERLKLARAGRRETGEMSDPVCGLVCRASIPKLAVVGRAALFAGFGVRQLDHVQTLAHRGEASRQLGQFRRHRVGHIDPSKEFRPTDAGASAQVGGVHMEEFDRGESDADPVEDVELNGDVVVVVVLRAGAALDLAQSPGSVSETFEHIHPDANSVELESALENRRDPRIDQGGCSRSGLLMPPRLLIDQRPTRKQQPTLAANLLPDVHRGTRNRRLVRLGLVHLQP